MLHSGIYYKPGSLKAVNSLAGRRAMLEFCDREGIPYKLCGKVIVAVGEGDEARPRMLHERGVANGIAVEVIGRDRLNELEPHAAGHRALYLPNAGIVDFRLVCDRLADRVASAGTAS